MTRHSNEGSMHGLQSTHPGTSPPRVNSTVELPSPKLAPSPSAGTCTGSSVIKVNAGGSVGCTTGSAPGTIPSPSASSISSSCDSRIPRPSSTGLRRSASMRMRGERISPHQPPPPPPSTAATAVLARHQHHHHRRLNFLQHQPHHHPDHRTFPVITENGTESPRQRSLVSNPFASVSGPAFSCLHFVYIFRDEEFRCSTSSRRYCVL